MIKAASKLDLRFILLATVCLFPILKFNVISIVIILFSLISIIIFFIQKEKLNGFFVKHFILNSILFFLLLISLAYSYNFDFGLNKLQQVLSLMVFPLIIFFLSTKIDQRRLNILLWVFTSACLLLTAYIYTEFISSGAFTALLNNDIKFWNNPFREVLYSLKYVQLHPSYYSLWICFSALFLTQDVFKQEKLQAIIIRVLLVLILVFTALLFSSRGPLLGFFVAFIIVLLSLFKSSSKKLIFLALVFTVIGVSVTQMSFLKSRFIDEFTAQEFRPPVGNAHTSTNIRVGIYTCVLQIFNNNNKFIGVGIGDVQKELDSCYQQFHTRVYEESNYNTHSSYFNILLATGTIGLIMFLVVWSYQFKLAYNSENKLYLGFLILIAVSMLFENILIRMHGAVFYALFNSIFVKNLFVNKSTLSRAKI